jgi:hypothetical protein
MFLAVNFKIDRLANRPLRRWVDCRAACQYGSWAKVRPCLLTATKADFGNANDGFDDEPELRWLYLSRFLPPPLLVLGRLDLG